MKKKDTPLLLTDEEWKKKLTPAQYKALRRSGTEPAFSGSLLSEKREGIYSCAACGELLFHSTKKFDSGTGWPSFDDPIPGAIETREDESFGMRRTEILCSRCGSHLGHVFDDGPTPTGKRFCTNSICLEFDPDRKKGGMSS